MHYLTDPYRRHFLARTLADFGGFSGVMGVAQWTETAHALPARTLKFPRDRGSHPEFRIEWWYITGRAVSVTPDRREFGFQVTFFRSRLDATQGLNSKFAAKQLLFAHVAITDVQGQKLWYDQRIARAGFDIASASEQDMAIKLRDWTLKAEGGNYAAELLATDFALKLQFQETQGRLLQGNQGLFRKGPDEKQASYYYSQPHLITHGSLQVKQQRFEVTGEAWLDHEWSQEQLHSTAVGWDWIGMNLDNGGALTAIRLRDKEGNAVWDGGSFRSFDASLRIFSRGEVSFAPIRKWKSPRTQTIYPVEWIVRTPTGTYAVNAVIDDQELDSRSSTGSIYWEGLSRLMDSQSRPLGSGYLEMTGYTQALRL